MIPGRKAHPHRPGPRDPPAGDRRRRFAARRGGGRRSGPLPPPQIGFDALEPDFLADLSVRSLAQGGDFLSLDFDKRVAVCLAGLSFDNPSRVALGGRGRGPVHRLLRRRDGPQRDRGEGLRLPGDGTSRLARQGLPPLLLPQEARPGSGRSGGPWPDGRARRRLHRGLGLRRLDHRVPAGRALPRRRRRPEGHRRARARPPLQAHRLQPVDGRRPPLERLQPDPGPGTRRSSPRTPSAAGRTSTWPRRCARPPRPSSAATAARATAPSGGCGRARSRAGPSIRTTRWPRPACGSTGRPGTRCRSPAACGRARCAVSGHTCDRVPLAIDPKRCVEREVVPHRLHLRRQELADHQLPAQRRAPGRPDPPAGTRSSRCAVTAALPLRGDRLDIDRRHEPDGRSEEIECKALMLADGGDGQRADPDALAQRAAGAVRPGRPPPRRQRRPRRGDRVRPEEGPLAARPARIPPVPQGQADHHDDLRLLGRAPRPPLRRHPLHPPGDLPLVADQLPLRRRTRDPAGDPSWWGLQKKQAIANWANRIELLAMVEDTHDGQFYLVPPPAAARCGRTTGRSPSAPSRTRCPSSRSGCARRPTRR